MFLASNLNTKPLLEKLPVSNVRYEWSRQRGPLFHLTKYLLSTFGCLAMCLTDMSKMQNLSSCKPYHDGLLKETQTKSSNFWNDLQISSIKNIFNPKNIYVANGSFGSLGDYKSLRQLISSTICQKSIKNFIWRRKNEFTKNLGILFTAQILGASSNGVKLEPGGGEAVK